jgi:Caudovirus prohead serine protease
MNAFIDIDMRVLEKGAARAAHIRSGGLRNAMFHDVKDRAIDGQSNRFNVPFPYGNGNIMLKPNCFGDLTNKKVGFRIDHIDSSELADTDGALSLMVDDERIQFRLDLEKCERGFAVARMCEIDSRSAVSIGCDITEEHNETIAGHSVRVVTRARLREISVCKDGCAGDDAFAVLVDTTATPKPVAGSRSATFNAAHALHKVSRKVRKLRAQIAAMYDAPPPVRWSMTLGESNRLQTLETERLQEYARLIHCC